MTDNEIIKAWERCIQEKEDDCLLCPLHNERNCTHIKDCDALDLVNRQKAEIEKYKEYYETMEAELDSFRKDQAEVKFLKNRIRAEAIKEFAERLKEIDDYVSPFDIDNLVKEMTEEQGNDR